jgi:hypothetical protein
MLNCLYVQVKKSVILLYFNTLLPRPSNSAIFGNPLAKFLTYPSIGTNLDVTQVMLSPTPCVPHIIALEIF